MARKRLANRTNRTNRTPKAGAKARTRTDAWKAPFLVALAQTGNVSCACLEGRVSRDTAYAHRGEDKAFAAAWGGALEEAVDRLDAEARRRAVEGVDEPVIYNGQLQLVGIDARGKPCDPASKKAVRAIPLTVKKYSDGLLQFLMKGARPEVYREKHQHTHVGKLDIRSGAEGATEAAALLAELREQLGDEPGPTDAGAKPA